MRQTPLRIAVLDKENPAQALRRVPLPNCYQPHVLMPTVDTPAIVTTSYRGASRC